ncbi:MAG: lytic transglycosylase domain-containing protein [Bacteroidota bacterium]|nr:lytic transglycosylase domain-containing protein [Bacteroidota bacterium]
MTSRNKATIYFFAGLVTGIFIIFQFAFKENNKKIENTEQSGRAVPPQIYIPKLPDQISFAGEKVPLDRWEVREAFDRELIYNYNAPGHITYLLKLSKRFFPVIEQRLKENGVPDDFKYLCVAEGNLQNLSSKVGASGFWQFMNYTGPGYNLEINDNVDQRYDVIKATDAACKYMKQAYAKFGNWTVAAASYNCGMGKVNDLASFQNTKYYYDLNLPDETNKYIFRILTFKYLMGSAKEMGFMVDNTNGYKPYEMRSVTVTSTIPNLAEWATANGTNYKMLKLFNPWLRDRSLKVAAGKSYEVRLPRKY